jgi:DNA-directed RNA polymerase
VWADLQARYTKAGNQKRFIMQMQRRKLGLKNVEWTIQERTQLGLLLVDLMSQHTGLIQTMNVSEGHHDTPTYVVGTAEAAEWMLKRHGQCELMNPIYMPMVVQPRPWTTPRDGGYLTLRGPKLVKTRNRAYLQELGYADMPQVYRAVNALQDTKWRVNAAVLAVVTEAWQVMGGGEHLGMPDAENAPLPAKCAAMAKDAEELTEAEQAEIKDWKRRAAAIHQANAEAVSKRFSTAYKIKLATDFAEHEAIYFPHVLDWRGRAYPLPSILQPQGDDLARGLLHFAEAKPLGEDGAYFLAVHIANLFGVDKVPFDERVQWVEENNDAIMDSAMNPLEGRRFWTTADSPWQALAACMEWMGYAMEGDAYQSRIPIAWDGSCNGLQNFSAMLRDEIGGRATNLMPSDRPADIYTDVAKIVSAKVAVEAAGGDATAALWVGNVNRKGVKRAVMTTPYGVTKIGMRDQLIEAIKKGDVKVVGDVFELSNFIAPLLSAAIDETVVAAREAMDWLKVVARTVAANDLPVRWVTPAGFPVLQEYRSSILKRVDTHVGRTRMTVSVEVDTDTLDRRRQAAGIAPNFVHSLDAAHMMGTINLCLDSNITSFAMVHDSYAVHACDAGQLGALLREAFVVQYTPDVLKDFRDQLAANVGPYLAAEFPPLPMMGSLDINDVLSSDFFFA